jgi:hypothetical protein
VRGLICIGIKNFTMTKKFNSIWGAAVAQQKSGENEKIN